MLTKDKAQETFARVLKHSKADETELLIGGGQSALTRFANNGITQNVSEENYSLSVRVNLGGRTARATTNKFDEDSIRRVVEAATNLAKVQAADADLLPMADAEAFDPAGPAPARNYFETSSIGPQERAAAVEKIVRVAQ